MENVKNEVSLQEHEELSIGEELKTVNSAIVSFKTMDDSFESKATIYNALNDTDFSLRDYIGKVIEVVNIVAQDVNMTDKQTGELKRATRCVLIDKDGASYGTISSGIKQAIIQICGTVGMPDTWEFPIPLKVLEKTSSNGFRFLTLALSVGKK